jgi:excisionase family DNA binding protein
MSEIVVIEKEKLPELFRQFAVVIVQEMRDEPKPILEIMTKKEIAEYLRCDVSKINRFMKNGMPFVHFGDTPRFYRADVDKWLREKK